MKIAVLGDIHANLEALTVVLEEAQKLGVEKYICIGDIVGYNSNPHECIEIVRSLDLLGVVQGNHDSYISTQNDLTGFNPQAAAAVIWTRKQLSKEELTWLSKLPLKKNINIRGASTKISLVHSTLDNPHMWGYIFDKYTAEASMQYQIMQLCFFGHTHVPLAFDKTFSGIEGGFYKEFEIKPNHKYLVNVGSVGQPRDQDPRAAFVTFDTKTKKITMHRLEYDIPACQAKIRTAGLPERLATRLAIGQ